MLNKILWNIIKFFIILLGIINLIGKGFPCHGNRCRFDPGIIRILGKLIIISIIGKLIIGKVYHLLNGSYETLRVRLSCSPKN